MTSAPRPSVVASVLNGHTYPIFAFDLNDLTILGANEALCKLLGRPADSLLGVPVTDIVSSEDHTSVELARQSLALGAVDGYRAVRRFQKVDGSVLSSEIWVRSGYIDGCRMGLVTFEHGDKVPRWPFDHSSPKIALAVTDHDWRIEQVSSEIANILGATTATYRGSPLLGLLQPADVQNFMAAVDDGAASTLRTRLRTHDDQWRPAFCLVVTMCEHSPPRLGLAIAAISQFEEELSTELHKELGVLGDQVFAGMEQLRSRLPCASISTRQWEILIRLARGEGVQEIAGALYLSPKTVRNHLSALYKKFGVHSQAGLLAKLLESLK
jgi:PAS domain S-box-containing protein